jgi:hypothetical protein
VVGLIQFNAYAFLNNFCNECNHCRRNGL